MRTAEWKIKDIAPDYGESAAVIGQNGTGKSFLVLNALLPDDGQVCIIDPKREIDAKALGMPVYSSIFWIKIFEPKRFIFRPSEADVDNLEVYDAVLKYCFKKKNFFIFVDDMVGIMDFHKWPQYLRKCYHLGRSKKVSVVTCFQRTAYMPGFLMSEAKRFYVFPLMMESDAKKLYGAMGEFSHWELQSAYEFFYRNTKEIGSKPVRMRLDMPEVA